MSRNIVRTLGAAAAILSGLLGTGCRSTVHKPPVDVFVSEAEVPPDVSVTSTDVMIPNPKVIFTVSEKGYLKKVTDGFIELCQGKAVGCAISTVGPGGFVVEKAAGDARRSPDGAPRKLSATDKITMASVSKTFTGTALQKLLYDKGICLDTPIGPYLPKHWKRSAAIDAVTFRQLLTHTSGLHCQGSTYVKLKTCMSTAVPCPGPQEYRNENFALMRILIPEVNGPATLKVLVDTDLAGNSKPIALAYAERYIAYVNHAVFAPAGLPEMHCKATDESPALSYKSVNPNDKWDFTTVGPGDP